MKGPAQTTVLVLAVIALAGGAFWGGTAYQKSTQTTSPGFVAGTTGEAVGARGGAMGQLSEEERAAFQSMSEAERQAFLEERFGGELPQGGGPGVMGRGGVLEGEVIEHDADTLTIALAAGGSQTVYTDGATLIATVEGAPGLTTGSSVLVISEPSADGVTTASVIVVKE